MICTHCKKEFQAKRKDARYCSAVCRQSACRNVTDNPVTDNFVTDKPIEDVTDKSVNACKVKSCYLPKQPGHNDMCIYHWRRDNDMCTISVSDYNKLNTSRGPLVVMGT